MQIVEVISAIEPVGHFLQQPPVPPTNTKFAFAYAHVTHVVDIPKLTYPAAQEVKQQTVVGLDKGQI